MASRGVTLVDSFGWRTPDFEKNVAATLKRQVGSGSIYILNDTVEQHYRKEKINNLNMVDRKNIVARRLNMAFPNYPTRAYYELKDKKKKPSVDKETLFLFSAIPSTDSLRKLLEAIKQSDCTVANYCLLPIESVDLVEKLASKVAKENRQSERSVWNILIGQHSSGGLRQIVIKNNQIALTRITPVVQPLSDNGAQWAADVVQEIQSTISYMARFGYAPDDGLDIILVAKPDFGALAESMLNIQCHFTVLTLQHAAELAGVNVGRNQEQYYSEALHLAWHAKKMNPVMPMKSREIESVANPRKGAFFAMLLLTAAFGYLAFNVASEALALNAAKANLIEVQKMQVLADQIYQEELKRKESLGIDIKLIQGSFAIYNEFEKLTFDPLPVLEVVSKVLKELRINSMEMSEVETPSANSYNADGSPAGPTKQVTLRLNFEFPGTVRPQDGNAQLQALTRRIVGQLPNYQVRFSKQLADLTYTGELASETGFTAVKRRAEEVYTGEIEIIKDLGNAGNTGTQ